MSEKEYEKCEKDCIVFKRLNNINEMLYYVLQFKGEPKKVNIKIVKFNLSLFAHKGSCFDIDVVLSNLPQWRTVVSLIKNEQALFFFKNIQWMRISS